MNAAEVGVFIVLMGVFSALGFLGSRFRPGGPGLREWALAGHRLGVVVIWFLLGADIFTAYTLAAVPSMAFSSGAIVFFTVPYAVTFLVAFFAMPLLWRHSKLKGYVTAADFVSDRFRSVTLGVIVAITGIVAELPYMAVQIDGMRAVLETLLAGTANASAVSEISLVLAFAVLAAFTYTSGLRGSALGAVLKDVLLWFTVIVLLVIVIGRTGGFHQVFLAAAAERLPTGVYTLKPSLWADYMTLAVGSALALYLYPHVINGALSAKSPRDIRISTILLPVYVIAVGLFALLGFAAYSLPQVLRFVSQFPQEERALLVVPAMAQELLPPYISAVVLAGIFIGGLVPAAIMAIAQANLLVRNVVGPFVKLSPQHEESLAKWASVFFKFLALGFVLLAPMSYALQLQLLGGIIITQTLPAVFLGLITDRLNRGGLIAGWAAGLTSGIVLTTYANHFGQIKTTSITFLGTPVFIGLLALAVNLAVALLSSLPGLLRAR